MTLDEKIGQMLELNLDIIGGYAVDNNQGDNKHFWKLNEAR
jgi:hypothetical protein